MSVSIQTVVFGDQGVQITYIDDKGVDRDTGIAEITTLEVPHEVLPTALLDDLVDSVETIIDEVRVLRRRPVEQFKAPR